MRFVCVSFLRVRCFREFRCRKILHFLPPPEYEKEYNTILSMTGRRKNKHPKRAENVKTVVVVRKGDDREEEEGEEEREEDDAERLLRMLMCVPCDDGVEQNHQMRKEETAIIAKGVKRKRGQHECDVCGKMCARPSKLAEHMRTHTKEKPYECDVCEKRFSQSGNLESHMRIHTNEKPYECDVCKKRYRHSDGLKYHMRTQH